MIQISNPLAYSDVYLSISFHYKQIRHLTMYQVTAEYRKPVIQALGKNLISLTLADCQNVDLLDLLDCPSIETLRLLMSCTLIARQPASPISGDPESFLPNLKTLESEICLKNFSPVLQEKSSLTNMNVECCHIGASSSTEWSKIAKLWPRMESLEMRRVSGLDVNMAERIFPAFGKLKKLALPHWMIYSKEERLASHLLKEKLESTGRISKISLSFKRPCSSQSCSWVTFDTGIVWETSNDGSSDESRADGNGQFLTDFWEANEFFLILIYIS